MVNTLVFDIGNVLIRWDQDIPFRRLIPDAAERAAFFRDILPPSWNLEQDRGRSWSEAEAERIALFPEYADLIRAYRRDWHDMVPGDIPENVAVLKAAKAARIPCYAITNFALDTFAETQARFPYLASFEGIVISARERVIKPDPTIFDLFLNRHSLLSQDCLFIDDSLKNVESARNMGFSTIHVTPELNLAEAVRNFGFSI